MRNVTFAPTFEDCKRTYYGRPRVWAALKGALFELADQPFHNPVLQSHRVDRAQGDTFTSRVGEDGHRLIWRSLDDGSILVLLFGEHDAVYRRAATLRLEYAPNEKIFQLYDVNPTNGHEEPYQAVRQQAGTLLMAWRNSELEHAGLERHEVEVLRRLDTLEELDALKPSMRPGAYELALSIAVDGMPSVHVEEQRIVELTGQGMLEIGLAEQLKAQPAYSGFFTLSAEAVCRILDQPIEDWMVFLHPDQLKAVTTDFRGPARIRGSAGTGKSVVALHRAHRMAQQEGSKILFTTYVKTLPPIFEKLYERMPGSGAGTVQFQNLHSWAFQFLRDRKVGFKIDTAALNAAFASACRKVIGHGSYLEKRGLGRPYYREEIEWVIKGRAVVDLQGYLALERTGRGTPLSPEHRTAVWHLYEAYQRELARAGTIDFADLLLKARSELKARPDRIYDGVIADEAQDLTAAGAMLLHEIAGNGTNGLVLVGDGQQSVYPGGYSLASVGVSISGRSLVLRTNYRNTVEILGFARRLIAGMPVPEMQEEGLEGPDEDPLAGCHGPKPTCFSCGSRDDQDQALVLAIQAAALGRGTGPGDLAVLVPTNKLVDEYCRLVEGLGFATQKLQAYDGRPTSLSRLGHISGPRVSSSSMSSFRVLTA